jgi:hypothetical protein
MGILSPGLIIGILAFLIVIFGRVLTRVKDNDGPVLGIRSLQALLVVLTGLEIFFVYRMFAG